MKIKVSLTIDIDPQAWADTLGGAEVDAEGNFKIAAIREDIKTYVLNLVQCSSLGDEAGGLVSL